MTIKRNVENMQGALAAPPDSNFGGSLHGREFFARLFFTFLLSLTAAVFAVSPARAQVAFPPGEIYFSPETNIEDKLIGFLHRAQGSIFLCARSLDSKKIAEKLIELRTKRMLPVKVILYKPSAAGNAYVDQFLYYNIDVVLAENPAGFDHNFCMIDFNSIYFSSADFSYKPMNQDYNYAMIISGNEKFAENFHHEFVEMFEGKYYGLASPVNTPNANITFNGATLDTAFLPEDAIDGKIASVISKAGSKIRVLANELKNDLMLDGIIGRKNSVSDISAVFEYGASAQSKDEYEKFRRAGIYAVYNRGFTRLNFGVIIIDNQYVMLFGANKSKNNSSEADSSFITINSSSVASAFNGFFDAVMQKNTFDITLTGQVLNASNKLPLDNTRVWFQSLTASAFTDHLGWYELKGTLPDEFMVTAEREYYFSKDVIILKKNGRRLDFLLNHIISYNSLSGFIIDKNTRLPVSGCGLVAEYIEQGTGTRTFIRTNTNEKGFFSFKALPLGFVDIEISHPNYRKKVEKSYKIIAGAPINLPDAITVETNYIITAYPNPVFEDNILINVKDSAVSAQVPTVTIKQNNYIEVPVSMKIAASADMKNIYVGNYIIKKGYYGAARINVNGGMSYKDVMIDFLQAYKKYTYAAPAGGASLSIGENAVRRSGYISMAADHSASVPLNGGELRPVGAEFRPIDISFSRGLALAAGSGDSFIEISVGAGDYEKARNNAEGGRPHIYRLDESKGVWNMLETAAYEPAAGASGEIKLKAALERAGKYAVFSDSSAPRIESVKARQDRLVITLKDEGSGLNEKSLSLFSQNRPLEGNYVAAAESGAGNSGGEREFIINGAGGLTAGGANICISDNCGNYTLSPLSKINRMAVRTNQEQVEVYPNPCRGRAKFRIRNAAGDDVSISIYDVSGNKLFDVCENFQLNGNNAEVLFNLDSMGGYGFRNTRLANSTFIYKVKFSSGAEKTGKLAIIK
ncbi:MAG: hypothetical protein BWY32_02658 [bacterium ADurb.Bin243]|nr:MAG: hypothetical protein BWY32_02658 [bacterium ADurb.Bin243]